MLAGCTTLAVAAAGLRRGRGATTVGAQAELAAGVTTGLTVTALVPRLLRSRDRL